MSPAIASSLGIVIYLALFATVGIVFLFVNLFVGKFVRPHDPHADKLEIYECGEPTIGSSFVQFDLRFYVVALLFIIFDVEVAFFFPWATVFGKSTNMADMARDPAAVVERDTSGQIALTRSARLMYQEMGVRNPTVPETVPPSLASLVPAEGDPVNRSAAVIAAGSRQLALVTIIDIAVFFAVLMVGFAYVWTRGDLDWVRAVSAERAKAEPRVRSDDPLEQEQMLSV
jgi:NADH-quinone oxidoreductase subunit A